MTSSFPARLLAWSLLLLSLSACRSDRPLVERLEQAPWQPVAFEISSMGGQRAADRVSFVLRLATPDGDRLTVEGVLRIDPQATWIRGNWTGESRNADVARGPVSSAAMEFFGGQGGRPSVGGQMTLSSGGTEIYRINLPPTELTVER